MVGWLVGWLVDWLVVYLCVRNTIGMNAMPRYAMPFCSQNRDHIAIHFFRLWYVRMVRF